MKKKDIKKLISILNKIIEDDNFDNHKRIEIEKAIQLLQNRNSKDVKKALIIVVQYLKITIDIIKSIFGP